MAQLTWQNVNADGLNGAVANAQKANDTMYSRVGDLVKAGQGLLGDMQQGIKNQWEFEREENTQEVINRMHEADSLEELKAMQDSLSVGSIRNQYGNKVDLSKVNQAKATWVNDAEARANKLNSMKDYSDDAIKLRTQVESLITAGEVEEARKLLQQNAGMLSNSLTDKLTEAIINKHAADRNYGLDARRVATTEDYHNAQINKINSEVMQSNYNFNKTNIDTGVALLNEMDKTKGTYEKSKAGINQNITSLKGNILYTIENDKFISPTEKQNIVRLIENGSYNEAIMQAKSNNIDIADAVSDLGYYTEKGKSLDADYSVQEKQFLNIYNGIQDKSKLPEQVQVGLANYFGNNSSGSNGTGSGTMNKNTRVDSSIVNNTGGITTSSTETIKTNTTGSSSGSGNTTEAKQAQQALNSTSVTTSPMGEKTSKALEERVNNLGITTTSPQMKLNQGANTDNKDLQEYYAKRDAINASNLSQAQKAKALNDLRIEFEENIRLAEARKFDLTGKDFNQNVSKKLVDIQAQRQVTAGSEISGLGEQSAIKRLNTILELSKQDSLKVQEYFRTEMDKLKDVPPSQRKVAEGELQAVRNFYNEMETMYDSYSRDEDAEVNPKTDRKYSKEEFLEKEMQSISNEAKQIIKDRVTQNANETFGTRENNPATNRVVDVLKSKDFRVDVDTNGNVVTTTLGSNEEIRKKVTDLTANSIFDSEGDFWDDVNEDEPVNFLNSNILTIKNDAVKATVAKAYIDMTAEYANKIKNASDEKAKNELRKKWQDEKKSFIALAQNIRPQDLTSISKQAKDANARLNELTTSAGQQTLMLELSKKAKHGKSFRELLREDKTYGLPTMSNNPIYAIPEVHKQARELENKLVPLLDRISGVSKVSNEKEIDALKTKLAIAQDNGSDTSKIEKELKEAQEKGAKGLSGISIQKLASQVGDINDALKRAKKLAEYDPEVWQPRVEALEQSYDTIVRYMREAKDAQQSVK